MAQQVPVELSTVFHGTEFTESFELAPDVAYERLAIANVVFCGSIGSKPGEWVLIDAGPLPSPKRILAAAAERYGESSVPAAIVLTHGHFDHVAALKPLLAGWKVPVYAHRDEHPFLDGTTSYPPPDPTVGGGMMSLLSPMYPRGPINISQHLLTLPLDGSIPELPGWQWLKTAGHTPGHISLYRERDGTFIAGDAVIATAQESAYAVAFQKPELHGPPMYYTTDWETARRSVETIAKLEPELIISGHGPALKGPGLKRALHTLADNFPELAVPKRGRYVSH